MKRRSPGKLTPGYAGVVAACFLLAMVAGWTAFANQIDNYAYDWMFRLNPPAAKAPESAIVAIDEASYQALGGVRSYRAMLSRALERLVGAKPKVVAIDLILTDRGDAREDVALAERMCATANLALTADLVNGRWEDPLPEFARCAKAVGHDKSDEDSPDGVTRAIPLEKRTDRERHWALSLEAFRLARRAPVVESPQDIQIGGETVPAGRSGGQNRPLRVLYEDGIPRISLLDLLNQSETTTTTDALRGKVVFVGVTSLSATRDRVMTPRGEMPGVEVHAQAFETLARGRFLVNASNVAVLAGCAAIALAAALIFGFLSGWQAYALGGVLLGAAHAAPFAFFPQGTVIPYFAPFATAWLTVVGAASYQHFVVRRDLLRSETERSRYMEAIHMVTHEMRTPLTAIQGSSELMGRYNLTDEKRQQIASMINSESKRLARMIQIFLDVERLSAGELELKQELFSASELFRACVERTRPLAERKNIRIAVDGDAAGDVNGDRELMEYALYNLMTNAVKYSPPDTEIRLASRREGDRVRISVRDQGIGMDARELKKIFKKFYRTKRAEASGEAGTGIGLSIVEQIVEHHGGKMDVASAVGKGSCFTVILPAYSRAARPPAVSV